MFKRLLTGIVLGVLVGAVVAAGIIKGLGFVTFDVAGGPWVAYAAAIVTGVFAGLLAGKPIWAKGAAIEVALKGAFGVALAAGLMFALRRWGDMSVNLGPLGTGGLGDLPAASLPIIGTLLSVFYEIDNTDVDKAEDTKAKAATKGRIAPAGARSARVAKPTDDAAEEDALESKAGRAKH